MFRYERAIRKVWHLLAEPHYPRSSGAGLKFLDLENFDEISPKLVPRKKFLRITNKNEKELGMTMGRLCVRECGCVRLRVQE